MRIREKIEDKVKSKYLSTLQDYIKDDLNAVNQLITERTEKREDLIPIISDYIFSSGGKRLRPALTLIAAKLFGYNGNKHHLLAAAVEFIHTATLLHDDVVDESSTRRGKHTVNNKWGNKESILVGDFLFSQAFWLMAQTENISALKILSEAATVIAEGEVLQLSSRMNLALNIEEYFKVIGAKTASLFSAACQVGAVVANASEDKQQLLQKFGYHLGIAFQLMDDVLDYSANEEALGKRIGDDFREGKVTLPIIIAYEEGSEEERSFWSEKMGHLKQREDDLHMAINILQERNIFTKVKKVAKEHIEEAAAALQSFEESKARSILLELLAFSAKRAY